MIASALLLAQVVAGAASTTPPPVAEWSALPIFPLPRATSMADGSSFVRAEVEAQRCRTENAAPEDVQVVAPVAILVGPAGSIRRIVPQAIDCPTVEQYTVGYILSLTRNGLGAMMPPAPGWYQLAVTYRW